MRVLFWLLLLGWLVWMISRLRRPALRSTPSKAPAQATTQDMVACAHCGLHLPKRDAVQGAHGAYCSTEHRAAANDHNPA
jgi:uncharacterized protein